MWFTRLAVSRPILIWMCLAALAVLGLQAYWRMPAELNPRADIPTVMVTTVYPGASPPEVETQVSRPLEEAVGTVGGVKDVFSSSQPNVSVLSIDFRTGTNLDAAVAEIRGRIEAVRDRLPAQARPPVVSKLDINALPVLYFGITSSSLSLQQLRHLATERIRPRLERVAGVAGVGVLGGEEREIRVAVDGARLEQYGLTLHDVVTSLKASGIDIPGGNITQGARETDVRLAGAFTSLEAIRNTPLFSERLARLQAGMQTFRPPGAPATAQPTPPPLTVGDVAEVRIGQAERNELFRINGRDGVGIVVSQASDANTVRVVEGVEQALKELASRLPADLERVTLRNDASTVRAALEDVNLTLVLGALLAMAVILLFLHNLRGTLIVSIAIPSCMVATFLVLWLAGFTLNQMTLLALSLSVGILVDDSIVVLESITRHLNQGETPREAALNGRSEIGFADMTTTLVDVVVFVPIAFMGGVVGGFFKQFGLTVAAATLFSLIVSFSVTPMLAARWYRQGELIEAKRGLFGWLERYYGALERRYRDIIRFALQRRLAVVALGVLSLAIIFLLSFHRLRFEFLPGIDQGQIAVAVELPPGSSLSATSQMTAQIEAVVRAIPEVEATAASIGQIVGGFGSIPQRGSQFAQINVRLRKRQTFGHREPGLRRRSDQEVTEDLLRRLQPLMSQSRARITATAVRSVQGISNLIELEIRGNDLDRITAFAGQVRDRIRQIPGVRDPDLSVRSGKPEIRATVDPVKAGQFGVPVRLAGAILRDSIAGNTETVFREGGEEYPVRVALKDSQRERLADVQNIAVGFDSAGQAVRLSDIADIALVRGPTSITRRNGLRAVQVTASLAPGATLGNVQRAIDRAIQQMPHSGLQVEWGGEARTLNENAAYFAN
ncbi:MAG: efflux RND transporter permease subunit, partial [Chloroherpetonaceae bacterium]|nr:efflux RND transporter permease subunit [Chthonomonadaceae bacterium]MDW8206223.1 efflux RND transporter permease subunit [Chloroherpetonaceae bacterium]